MPRLINGQLVPDNYSNPLGGIQGFGAQIPNIQVPQQNQFLPMNQYNANNYGSYSAGLNNAGSAIQPQSELSNWWSNGPWSNQTDPITGFTQQGLVPQIGGAALGAANTFLGIQGLGLARDQFDFQRDAFNQNFDYQRSLTERELADRDARRRSSSQ